MTQTPFHLDPMWCAHTGSVRMMRCGVRTRKMCVLCASGKVFCLQHPSVLHGAFVLGTRKLRFSAGATSVFSQSTCNRLTRGVRTRAAKLLSPCSVRPHGVALWRMVHERWDNRCYLDLGTTGKGLRSGRTQQTVTKCWRQRQWRKSQAGRNKCESRDVLAEQFNRCLGVVEPTGERTAACDQDSATRWKPTRAERHEPSTNARDCNKETASGIPQTSRVCKPHV